MTSGEGVSRLQLIARRWRRRQRIAALLRGSALAMALCALGLVLVPETFTARTFIVVVVASIGLGAGIRSRRSARAEPTQVARHLDRELPALEDSTTLILRDPASLLPLERLQRRRTLGALAAVEPRRFPPPSLLRRGAGELAAGFLVAALVLVISARVGLARETIPASPDRAPLERLETVGSALDEVVVEVVPPGYTGRDRRLESTLDLEVEEGALITWRLPARDDQEAFLVPVGGTEIPFSRPRGGDAATASRRAGKGLIYRLELRRGTELVDRSALARLEVRPDLAPVLEVISPAHRVLEVTADTRWLALEIRAEDDFGLAEATLVATLALGAGEMVEFRERRVPLDLEVGRVRMTLRHRLDLVSLGLEPAAELYFHVEARDGRRPDPNLGRTGTRIIRIPGAVRLSADLDAGMPIIMPPEFFRSQRQIIIDTERLIADRPVLSKTERRRRAEGLGADQRALRMRYGTLLGEEFVSGRALAAGETEAEHEAEGGAGHAEEHDDEPDTDGQPGIFGSLPSGLYHSHDSAEMATYFASETRTLLKGVLGWMWEAEGKLRGVDPEGALPAEYRALELLKELQQRSRIYVQRVGFEAPPLEPARRRLTGELEEIDNRHHTDGGAEDDPVVAAARHLLTRLEAGDSGARLDGLEEERDLLRSHLTHLATTDAYALDGLALLEDLATGRLTTAADLAPLRRLLWRILPAPERNPRRAATDTDPLGRSYRALLGSEDEI